jgi:hypothetical protein
VRGRELLSSSSHPAAALVQIGCAALCCVHDGLFLRAAHCQNDFQWRGKRSQKPQQYKFTHTPADCRRDGKKSVRAAIVHRGVFICSRMGPSRNQHGALTKSDGTSFCFVCRKANTPTDGKFIYVVHGDRSCILRL